MDSKLQQFIFYLLLFCLPLQTRVLFYSSGGRFIEWSSVFFYLTDGLVLLLLMVWGVDRFVNPRRGKPGLSQSDYGFGGFLTFSGGGLFLASGKTPGTF